MPQIASQKLSRRTMLAGSAAAALATRSTRVLGRSRSEFSLASFSADVTVPVGHPLMGGGIAPASRVADPLEAHGIVVRGGAKPVVLLAVDWCEIRNDAYDQWRTTLAEAAETDPRYVLVSAVHQHDAPVADLEAQRILDAHGAQGKICDLQFHERAVQKVAAALRAALKSSQTVTHVGTGQADVEQIASNRRYHAPDGTLRFDRTSASQSELAHTADEGLIDPRLKSLSFWNHDQPLAVINSYATHPMSYYGRGEVSADFVGLARRRRQQNTPGTKQIYISGASGNLTAGKYNDGSSENRGVLADRLYRAMDMAWRDSERHPLTTVELIIDTVRFAARSSAGFTAEDFLNRISNPTKPFDQCLAALGLSYRERILAGRDIDVPLLQVGPVRYLLLPGEAYVEYQLYAQSRQPHRFVMVSGYGECATGYIPTEKARQENDSNLADWCWVDPGAEQQLKVAIARLLSD